MKSITIKNVTIGEGMPKICVPIVGITKNDILEEIEKAILLNIDLLEWRVDWYEHCLDVQKIIQMLKEIKKVTKEIPIIFTFRTAREGGAKDISVEEYAALLDSILPSQQLDIIDIELFAGDAIVLSILQKARECSVYTILSSHDFQKTPEEQEIIMRLCHMQELGSDMTKIAVMPHNTKDVLTLLSATEKMQHYGDRPFITMSMGGLGSISRMAGEVFGSAITFGVGEKSSAPGQIETKKLKHVLNIIHESIAML